MAGSVLSPKQSVVWIDSSKKKRGWPSPSNIITKAPILRVPSRPQPGVIRLNRQSLPSSLPSDSLPCTPPTPRSTTSSRRFSARHLAAMSPLPWIDLASDVGSRRGSVGSQRRVSSIGSRSMVPQPEVLAAAAGYERESGVPYATLPDYETDARSLRSEERETGRSKMREQGEQQPDDEETVYPTGLRFILVCISLCLSSFPPALDRTIVATAIPQITNDFNSLTDASWYGAVYLLFATAFQPTFGKVFQVFNVKAAYVLAIAIFLIGSLMSAVSRNSLTFIIGRALSGLGGGGLFSGGLTVIAYTVPLKKRPAFTGMLGALFGEIALFVGPVIGGAFTDSQLTWRWCFYINLPITGLAVAGIVFCLENPNVLRSNKTFLQNIKELDYIGPIIFLPANIMLLLALQFGGSKYAWVSPGIFGLLFSFVILMGLWVYSQYKLGERATIPFSVLYQRTVLSASWFGFFSSAGFTLLATYAPYYFQAIYGSSALESGVQTLPLIITSTVFSVIAGILITVIGYYTPIMIVGMLLSTVAAGLLTTLDVTTPYRHVFGFLFLAGVGIGMNLQSPIIAVQAVVDLRQIPIATALVLFFTQLGGGIAVALAQSVIVNHLFPAIESIDPEVSIPDIIKAGATGLKDLVSPEQLPAVLVAYANSIDLGAFVSCTVFFGMAFLTAFGVEWRNVNKQQKTGNNGKDLEKEKDADAEQDGEV